MEKNNKNIERLEQSHIQIMKFGGSSVGKIDGIHSIGDIVEQERKNGPILVVVSALNGTTDQLFSLVDYMKNGDEENVERTFSNTVLKHMNMAYDLGMTHDKTRKTLESLARVALQFEEEVFGVRDSVPNKNDRIVAFGEQFSARLVAGYLQYRGNNALAFDSSKFVKTDSQFGGANPLWEQTRERVRHKFLPMLRNNCVPVITGFCGSTEYDDVTILKRGGSDLMASGLARELGANRLTFFKEVDGVYDQNPNVYDNALRFDHLSYEEAHQMSQDGHKVLAPGCIEPLLGTNIQAEVRSTFNPFVRGTVISS